MMVIRRKSRLDSADVITMADRLEDLLEQIRRNLEEEMEEDDERRD